jgi:hypothetical protein
MSARSIVSASPIASVVLALACAPGGDTNTNVTEKAGGTPPVVTLMATDYAYEAPGTVSAGFTVFRLVNRGDEFHGATIVRLEPGRTLPEYIDAYGEAQRTRGARPVWAKFLGGPYAPPHAESTATLYLEPGTYAWVCFAPGSDGNAHLLTHKQAHAFVVRPRSDESPASSAPEPTASLRLLDYSFQFGGPLTAGKHTIQVENVGVEPHHVLMFKLAPAKTMEDYRAWIQRNMQGEPAATFVSAMAELSTGAAAYFQADLSAGDYVLVCLITGRDEVSHAAKGMLQHIRIG